MLDVNTFADDDAEAGIYTWSLGDDLVYGDTTVAAIFGLDPAETLTGLSISEYVQRIHPDDRGDVARLISAAVRDGRPYHSEYRAIDADGEVRRVISLGRCFRDRSGEPVHYAGIVYPVDRLR
jgi:PAS domain S-box-containing protein